MIGVQVGILNEAAVANFKVLSAQCGKTVECHKLSR